MLKQIFNLDGGGINRGRPLFDIFKRRSGYVGTTNTAIAISEDARRSLEGATAYVMYKGLAEASKVTGGLGPWLGLHHTVNETPEPTCAGAGATGKPIIRRTWRESGEGGGRGRGENTGTPYGVKPKGSLSEGAGGRSPTAINEAWTPDCVSRSFETLVGRCRGRCGSLPLVRAGRLVAMLENQG